MCTLTGSDSTQQLRSGKYRPSERSRSSSPAHPPGRSGAQKPERKPARDGHIRAAGAPPSCQRWCLPSVSGICQQCAAPSVSARDGGVMVTSADSRAISRRRQGDNGKTSRRHAGTVLQRALSSGQLGMRPSGCCSTSVGSLSWWQMQHGPNLFDGGLSCRYGEILLIDRIYFIYSISLSM